jgi:DNA segregation ATPase FtsK/SpoIIIE-like protein
VPEGVELDPDIINSSEDDKADDIVIEAVRVALRKNTKYLTTAFLQRNLHIGYGRAASILDYLLEMDLVSDHQNGKGYEITVKSEKELDDFLQKNSK